jgi:hypothetical protein
MLHHLLRVSLPFTWPPLFSLWILSTEIQITVCNCYFVLVMIWVGLLHQSSAGALAGQVFLVHHYTCHIQYKVFIEWVLKMTILWLNEKETVASAGRTESSPVWALFPPEMALFALSVLDSNPPRTQLCVCELSFAGLASLPSGLGSSRSRPHVKSQELQLCLLSTAGCECWESNTHPSFSPESDSISSLRPGWDNPGECLLPHFPDAPMAFSTCQLGFIIHSLLAGFSSLDVSTDLSQSWCK